MFIGADLKTQKYNRDGEEGGMVTWHAKHLYASGVPVAQRTAYNGPDTVIVSAL